MRYTETIKLTSKPTNSKASKFVDEMYSSHHPNPMNPNQLAMVYGSNKDQQLALWELETSLTDPDTVHIKFVSAYPQRQGVGTKAMREMQELAADAGVKLELTVWKKGPVSELALRAFYKKMGFKQTKRGTLIWEPSKAERVDDSTQSTLEKYMKNTDGTVRSINYDNEFEEMLDEDLRVLIAEYPELYENDEHYKEMTEFLSSCDQINGIAGNMYIYASVNTVPVAKIVAIKYFPEPLKLVKIVGNRYYFDVNGEAKPFPEGEHNGTDLFRKSFLFSSMAEFNELKTMILLKFSEWRISLTRAFDITTVKESKLPSKKMPWEKMQKGMLKKYIDLDKGDQRAQVAKAGLKKAADDYQAILDREAAEKRDKEQIKESALRSIEQHDADGSLEGYVVSTDQVQLGNYLSSQGADQDLISRIAKRYGTVGIIKNIWVDEDQRGQGVGSGLLESAIDEAFSIGADAIVLVCDTGEDNSQMSKTLEQWYQGWGFRTVGIAGGDPVMVLDRSSESDGDDQIADAVDGNVEEMLHEMLAKDPTVGDLAEKYKCSLLTVEIELEKGIKAEMSEARTTEAARIAALRNIQRDLHHYSETSRNSGSGKVNEAAAKSKNPLTHKDPVEVWIKRFRSSTHPKLKGKTPAQLEKMARAAQAKAVQNNDPYASKKVTEHANTESAVSLITEAIANVGHDVDLDGIHIRVSEHFVKRMNERGLSPRYVAMVISKALRMNRAELDAVPSNTQFVIKDSYDNGIAIDKSMTRHGSDMYTLVTVHPNLRIGRDQTLIMVDSSRMMRLARPSPGGSDGTMSEGNQQDIKTLRTPVRETGADGATKTLYHGTLAKNVPSIMKTGLLPRVGQFTKGIHGDNAMPKVFATTEQGARAVYCALASQIYHAIGHMPSAAEMAKLGAVLVIRRDAGKFQQYDPNAKDVHGSLEPGDYHSDEPIAVDEVLTGQELLDWIKQHDADHGELKTGIEENSADGKEPSRPGKQVVDAIRLALPMAQEIWFHGSRAIGKHRKDSDTDILVVIPKNVVGEDYVSAVRTLQQVGENFHNYDIQPCHPGNHIHRIAKEEGKLLWSSTNENYADGKGPGKISFKIKKQRGKFSTTMLVDATPVGIYQYDSRTGRSIAEMYPEFRGQGLGKILVLHAIYTAARLGMDFQEDESRTAEYDNVLDSLSSSGYIVDDDGYWYVTEEGERFLKGSLTETKQRLDPRCWTGYRKQGTKIKDGVRVNNCVPRESVDENTDGDEVAEFLDSLTPDDVGVDTVGPYRIHYEGFSDWCNQDAEERCSLPPDDQRHLASFDDIYDEVLRDFIKRENGRQPIRSGLVGSEENPILYAVFDRDIGNVPGISIDGINEAFNKPYPLPARWKHGYEGQYFKHVDLPNNGLLNVSIDWEPNDKIAIWNFSVNNSQMITGTGDAFRIFATAIAALRQFVKSKKPSIIAFIGNDQDPSRIKMYDKLVPWLIDKGGLSSYNDVSDDEDLWPDELLWFFDERYDPSGKMYVLASDALMYGYDINENFADGKGPGKPGDSQRHGIPKNATMAQLEKAAKAPGRKGQLARWQMNMRRGKVKESVDASQPQTLPDGTEIWRNANGNYHRDDGPAVVSPDGGQEWYIHGERHREDGPAAIWPDGTQRWFRNGKLHRDDGPAVMRPDGTQRWFRNGDLHRDDGPAITFPDGGYSWYYSGWKTDPLVSMLFNAGATKPWHPQPEVVAKLNQPEEKKNIMRWMTRYARAGKAHELKHMIDALRKTGVDWAALAEFTNDDKQGNQP